jgi:poly [ADP-ribose] polymerase
MLDLCRKGKVDISEDDSKAKMEIGKIIVANKNSTADEVMGLIVEQFGFSAVKEEQQKTKTEAATAVCGHPGNVGIMEAINELSSLYFKDGNANAGGTYKKVASAIKELDFEITADNAKGLGKGKTKVAGIGKGSADKIHEFVTTGSIEKLEEKRAAA